MAHHSFDAGQPAAPSSRSALDPFESDFHVGNLWGEDLEGEGLRPLLWAVKKDAGWGYDVPPVKNSELCAVSSTFDWSPPPGEEAFILLSQLINGECVFIDAELEDWLGAGG